MCRVCSWLQRNRGAWGAAPQGLCSQSLQPSQPPCKPSFLPQRGAEGRGRPRRHTRIPLPRREGPPAPHRPACTPARGLASVRRLRAPRVLSAVGLPTAASARQPKAAGWPSSAAHRLPAAASQSPPWGEPTPSGTGTAVEMPMGTGTAPGPGLGEQPVPPRPPRQVPLHLQSGSSGNRSVKRGHRKG